MSTYVVFDLHQRVEDLRLHSLVDIRSMNEVVLRQPALWEPLSLVARGWLDKTPFLEDIDYLNRGVSIAVYPWLASI